MTLEPKINKPDHPSQCELTTAKNIHGWSHQSILDLQRKTADALTIPVVFRDVITSVDFGPEMVVIPPGTFLMGPGTGILEPKEKEELPQHTVTLTKPFAIGKYPVTFEEFDYFRKSTDFSSPNSSCEGWGRGKRPVINISWASAHIYCGWLTEQTGHHYRLPSESEWEYACRAGSATVFPLGATITPKQANYDGRQNYRLGELGQYRKRTLPVDYTFPDNAFGLSQMIGNVWEWCEDRWHGGYLGAPSDESPWTNGASENRVIRGGSWYSGPHWLRSASRAWWLSDGRDEHIGFRLVRDI